MSRLLIIDDDRDFARSLQLQLELEEHEVATANTADEGIAKAATDLPDLILLDLKLRETDGLEVMGRLRASGVQAPVAIITGEQDMQSNIRAFQQGVLEYLRKPFGMGEVLELLKRLEQPRPNRSDGGLVKLRKISDNPREIVGADPVILDLLKQIGLLSRSRVTVLIQGESGTGKEVVARALHDATGPETPFVPINCTAVVPTLLESELFGHEKGAFTGAERRKPGSFQRAGEGTLFLDEVGDMPVELQPKLLRVIQEREFTPVGAVASLPFKARLVVASNRNLAEMVAREQFREDLYYRLAVTTLHVPPLRQRKGDIELITHHLLWRVSRDLHRPVRGITAEALAELHAYDWPGNVRELANVLTRAVALAQGDVLAVRDLRMAAPELGALEKPGAGPGLVSLADVERDHVKRVLDALEWNISRAARKLGISRPTLRSKIRHYGLESPE